MEHEDDFDPEFYGPKPNEEKAAAIAMLMGLGLLVIAIAYAVGRAIIHWIQTGQVLP